MTVWLGMYGRSCGRCTRAFSAVTRTQLFKFHGLHLRDVHFPEWKHS